MAALVKKRRATIIARMCTFFLRRLTLSTAVPSKAIWSTGGARLKTCRSRRKKVELDRIKHCHGTEAMVIYNMGKKFISVTLDLDEETLKILEKASAKRGSSVSHVSQELISKALHEHMQSREEVLRILEETIRAMGTEKSQLLDRVLARTGKEGPQGRSQPADEGFDLAHASSVAAGSHFTHP